MSWTQKRHANDELTTLQNALRDLMVQYGTLRKVRHPAGVRLVFAAVDADDLATSAQLLDQMGEPACPSTYTIDRRTGEKLRCASALPEHPSPGFNGMMHEAMYAGIHWYWSDKEADKQ